MFENQFFSEHLSFLSQQPSLEYVEGLEDCELYFIYHEDLIRLYQEIQKFQQFGRLLMEHSFIRLKVYFHSLLHETAQERYLKLIETQPNIFQRIPLKYIASYIGITDSSLSRIRKKIAGKNHFLPFGK